MGYVGVESVEASIEIGRENAGLVGCGSCLGDNVSRRVPVNVRKYLSVLYFGYVLSGLSFILEQK